MARPVIIACAVTGSADTVDQNPAVPVTPEQIANEAIAANKAGAAIVHIHVRNPETGKASMKVEYYEEVVKRIRDSGSPVIINLTTGPGGRFVPDPKDPMKAAEGSAMKPSADRVEHVVKIRPDICSLDVATMNFGERPMVNSPDILREMATMIQAAGVKPELEVFDLGHIRFAKAMVEEGLINAPPMFQLCLGIPWGADQTVETMAAMKAQLPSGASWASFGISRGQMPMMAAAVALGGNVRVGLEDNIYLDRGVLATNGQLVTRAREIIERMGARIITPQEARNKLGLRGANG